MINQKMFLTKLHQGMIFVMNKNQKIKAFVIIKAFMIPYKDRSFGTFAIKQIINTENNTKIRISNCKF